jgi:hypothetical protein
LIQQSLRTPTILDWFVGSTRFAIENVAFDLAMRMASHVDRWPLAERKDAQRRPVSPDRRIDQGIRNPILVGLDRVIIAGHARLAAARKPGLTEARVIKIKGLTENRRRALSIADNKLLLNAGWDDEILRREIEALRDADYGLDLLGSEDDELAKLLAQKECESARPGGGTIQTEDCWLQEEQTFSRRSDSRESPRLREPRALRMDDIPFTKKLACGRDGIAGAGAQ